MFNTTNMDKSIDSKTNIYFFVEHKVNFNYKEHGNEYTTIENIPFSLKQFWIKEWYELPLEKKLIFIKQNIQQ